MSAASSPSSQPTCSPGQFGFETADLPDKSAALEKRLSALEASRNSQRPTSPDLTARLAAAEAKLGTLEQLDANIDGVSKKQGGLRQEPQRAEREAGHSGRRCAGDGTRCQARGAAFHDGDRRRARSPERPPAAARRHHRPARRSGIDPSRPSSTPCARMSRRRSIPASPPRRKPVRRHARVRSASTARSQR
ncbi:MAG: hypothetical protein WDN31_22560 [Hyphomicrobium sp.]